MMGISWVFVVINVFLACDGFLLDDRTSPATTSGPLLSDQHYNFLINLIMNERQTRAKLEQHVVLLEQELLATQQGVTDIYHTSSTNNATLEQQTKNWNALHAKYINLENDNSLMKLNLNALRTDHTNLQNYTEILEREVTSLRHIKGVTDLQTVLDVRNETNILREEIKITNNSLNSVRNEADARKQDFVSLLNKAESTEQKLEFSIKKFDNKLEYQQNQTKLKMKLMQDEMQRLGTYQNQTFTHEIRILREELKITNNSINSLRNEAEARKQDFVALLNKADSIEQKLELTVKALDTGIHNVSETLQSYVNKQIQTELEIKQMQNEMQDHNLTLTHFQENLTVTEEKFNMEIHNMSNRAAFTVCATENSYSNGSIIRFPTVQTRHGISNSALATLRNPGKFRCEKAGLYLISGFLMTETKEYARLDLYKNDNFINLLYFSVTSGNSYQTSTILILQYLSINDTVYISAAKSIHVYGSPLSCISFLQLTN